MNDVMYQNFEWVWNTAHNVSGAIGLYLVGMVLVLAAGSFATRTRRIR